MSDAESKRPALPLDRFRWITEPLAYWAAETPERIAATDPFATFTFADLQAAVEALAAHFEGRGVAAGDRVLIVMENCLAGAVAMLAAARLKAWAVPLNARLTAREVDAIRDHCRPRALVYTAGVSPEARDHAERHGAEPLAAIGPLEALVSTDPATTPEPASDDPAQQVAALIYTTGTTGAPKGVMLTHDNLLFTAGRSSQRRELRSGDRVHAVLPISHVFGLSSVFLGTLYQGARLDLIARFDPREVAHALAEEGATVFQGVPAGPARRGRAST